MATIQDQKSDDDNMSDFDNSEDLASLLGDDDDDIFAKKIYGNSPTKNVSSAKISPVSKKNKEELTVSSAISVGRPSNIAKSLVKPAKDDLADDILNDFIDSSVNFEPSMKNKIEKESPNFEDNDDSIDLNSSQISPSKDLSSPSKSRQFKHLDEDSGALSSAEKPISKPSKQRRGSFFDDFLQTLSPKHDAKQVPEKKNQINEANEDDILGAYIPTTPKNIEAHTDTVAKSSRRGSLFKQVSFKDIADDFPESDMIEPKTHMSPTKEITLRRQSLSQPKSELINKSKRVEKLGTSKDQDVDWENFFKENPKLPTESLKMKDNTTAEEDLTSAKKQKLALRRQSSADWLGLSENKILDSSILEDRDGVKVDERKLETLIQTKPRHSGKHVVHRHQASKKESNDWNDFDNFEIGVKHSTKSDMSEVLVNASQEQKSVSLASTKSTSEISNAGSFATSTPKYAALPASKMQLLPDQLENISSELQLRTVEQNTAIFSMQSLLDDAMQERKKLMKDNEIMKQTYEEKIKAMEELHRTEKKSSGDLHKTLESSLKNEFEIKIKTLEERLNLMADEKEKQENVFKEKLENMLKEHQMELQRLKNLHSQSINIMKNDHEEALSRLKQLKNQEVEAVLSSQVHTKSLQYLSDQLEARANELALLQNKVEERNQTTWNEKQSLLDAKEINLKALENRLQKQLESSEDERTRLQQLVLRLESRLQKLTMEGEEDRYEVLQMKARLTVQQQYLEEEKKLSQHQIEKEKEKLRISQDSILYEQKNVLLQLAQERQQLVQEKIDLQSLSKHVKEDEARLNVKKLKEESYIESQKQYLQEEENKLHFEKERVKHELYQLERERDSLEKEKQQIQREKVKLNELDIHLKRKSVQIEELAATAAQELEKGRREYTEADSIKTEQQLKMQRCTQEMHMLMDKERQILLEKEQLIKEKLEFEQNKQSALCTRCKFSIENPIPAPPAELQMPVIFPLPHVHGITNQVQQSFVDPHHVIWHLAAQKDREFLQQELAFLQSLKVSNQKHQ